MRAQGVKGWSEHHVALKDYRAEMQEKAMQFHPITQEDLKATGAHTLRSKASPGCCPHVCSPACQQLPEHEGVDRHAGLRVGEKSLWGQGQGPFERPPDHKVYEYVLRTDFPLRTGAPVRCGAPRLGARAPPSDLMPRALRCLRGMADEPRQVLWHRNWFLFPLSCEKRHESCTCTWATTF